MVKCPECGHSGSAKSWKYDHDLNNCEGCKTCEFAYMVAGLLASGE